MIDYPSDQVAYCETALVPIWERWAGSPRLLREALACAKADEDVRATQRQRVVAAITALVPRRSDPGTNAAVCAALAVLCVIGGDMGTDFWAVAAQALDRDREARGRVPRTGGKSSARKPRFAGSLSYLQQSAARLVGARFGRTPLPSEPYPS